MSDGGTGTPDIRVLVINCGSSSLKYQVCDVTTGEALASGLVERVGLPDGLITHTVGERHHTLARHVDDHEAAIVAMRDAFATFGPVLDDLGLAAIGHRVVQGGDRFADPVLIDDAVITAVEETSALAPLHNPANLQGIAAARRRFPELPHVAVFDTAFHQTLPPQAYTYALDREVAAQHQVRRYGFHGTSHQFVARAAADFCRLPRDEANIIVAHLGNGASMAAVRGGVSVDTSMGLTPLEGLVMGTRSGDLDPAVIFHLAATSELSLAELDDLLNRRSGLLGLTGRSDVRDVVAAARAGDEAAELGLAVYCYRLRKYVGAYTAVLGRVDALAFTAGVGENSADVRSRALAGLEPLGYVLDETANGAAGTGIRDLSAPDSRIRILVVPTNEEWEIARQSARLVDGGRSLGA